MIIAVSCSAGEHVPILSTWFHSVPDFAGIRHYKAWSKCFGTNVIDVLCFLVLKPIFICFSLKN